MDGRYYQGEFRDGFGEGEGEGEGEAPPMAMPAPPGARSAGFVDGGRRPRQPNSELALLGEGAGGAAGEGPNARSWAPGGHGGLSEMEMARIHAQLRQLAEDERSLLANSQPHQARDIQERFFHQRMSLLMQLPPEQQEPYHPKPLLKMGTLRDNPYNESPESHRPYFVTLMFVVNLIMFVLAIGENGWKLAPASENPTIGPSPKVLMDLGAKRADCILDEGQWWRFIAPMLLHAGVLHIVGNMVVLMRLGYSMEQAFGTFRVATIYLVSGFGGNLASAIFLPQVVVVGASGALFGLIGALFGDFIQNFRVIREGRWCYLLQLVVVSGVGLAMGIFPLIDNFSHIGGWLCGILAGTAFLAGAQRDPATGKRVINCWTVPLAFLCVVLLTGLLIAGVSVFYSRNDSDSFCSWCKNLSCVETQYWNCCSVRPDEDCTAQANNTVLYHC